MALKEYYPADIYSDRLPENTRWAMMPIRVENTIHVETVGFPLTDPWSVFFRTNLERLKSEGLFKEKRVAELGVGDGRNIKIISDEITEFIGVDIVPVRLDAAWVNLSTDRYLSKNNCPIELYNCGAEEFLPSWKLLGERKFPDVVLMCLPQSPEGKDLADAYRASPLLLPFRQWDKYGLTLNAAALANMFPYADNDTRVVTILSDRIPAEVREHFIRSMGWEVEQEFKTSKPVQQDPDTGIEYTQSYDDGNRFYEKRDEQYILISAVEAEKRRLESIKSGKERAELNVYHHLSVYVLKRGDVSQPKELRYGSSEVNFFRTTESWSLPIFNMPESEVFSEDEANILGITASGQLLDYAALLGNKIRQLDLIDFNPTQNIWAAYLLINMLDFKDDRIGHRKHITNREINVAHVEEDIRAAISYFHLDSYLTDFLEIDIQKLAQSFICYRNPPEVKNTEAAVPVDKLTDDNLRFYFTLHDDLFDNLYQIIERHKIRFYQGAIEQFKSAVQYQSIYLSDVHPWTDQVALLDKMQELLVSGGSFYFSTYGVDEEAKYNYMMRDMSFVERLRERAEQQGDFSWELVSPIEQSGVIERVLDHLGYKNASYTQRLEFILSGASAFPPKQKIPILVRKR